MSTSKSLTVDRVLWVFVIVLAFIIAFAILQRDKQRNFGGLAYGGFPEFSLKTIDGKPFDYHRLKAAVWAIHQGSSSQVDITAKQLIFIAQATASGKRHMNILTFAGDQHSPTCIANKYQYILPASPAELNKIFGKLGIVREDTVLLIDQNGAIRGRYDFTSPDDFRSFRQDLLRIL